MVTEEIVENFYSFIVKYSLNKENKMSETAEWLKDNFLVYLFNGSKALMVNERVKLLSKSEIFNGEFDQQTINEIILAIDNTSIRSFEEIENFSERLRDRKSELEYYAHSQKVTLPIMRSGSSHADKILAVGCSLFLNNSEGRKLVKILMSESQNMEENLYNVFPLHYKTTIEKIAKELNQKSQSDESAIPRSNHSLVPDALLFKSEEKVFITTDPVGTIFAEIKKMVLAENMSGLRKISDILINNPNILNFVDCDGVSIVFLLSLTPVGRDLIAENSALRNMISVHAFNAVVTAGADIGTTAFYWFTRDFSRPNCSIALEDKTLRDKILPESLAQGDEGDISPLLAIIGSETGRDILLAAPDLVLKIKRKDFNEVYTTGSHKSRSPLFSALRNSTGRKLLCENEYLRNLINKEAFTAICTEGDDADTTPFFWLTLPIAYKTLVLLQDERLQDMVSDEDINRPCQSDKFKGVSAAFNIISYPNEEGLDLLLRFKGLREKISSEALVIPAERGPLAGITALFFLVGTPKGISFLKNSPDFRKKITADGLLLICNEGPNQGLSPMSLLVGKNPDAVSLLYLLLDENEDLLNDLNLKLSIPNRILIEKTLGRRIFDPWLMGIPQDRDLLFADANSLELITVPGLNTPCPDGPNLGIPALYLLAKTTIGMTVLREHNSLRAKITKEGLNTIFFNEGMPVLYWLAGTYEGRKLLCEDPILRAKITTEGLNAISNENMLQGTSALYWLARNPDTRKLLQEDDELRAKITPEGLNSVWEAGSQKGESALFFLTLTPELICKDDILRSKITSDGLNATCQEGDYQGASPLSQFASTASGIDLLCNDANLRMKITPHGLNTHVHGAGASVIFSLCFYDKGIKLLCEDLNLRAKITSEGLNALCNTVSNIDTSALYLFISRSEGRQLLIADEVLRKKITREGLNAIVTRGEYKGQSPLFCLAGTPEGRVLLNDDSGLRALITAEGLNHICEEAPDTGKSALFFLIMKPESLKLISEDEDLRSKITDVGLNSVFEGESNASMSILLCLLLLPQGRKILFENLSLINKISATGLNTICQVSPHKGESALLYFTGSPELRNLLRENANLRGKITTKGLHTVCQEGLNKGSSASLFLTRSSVGQMILNEDSVLREKVLDVEAKVDDFRSVNKNLLTVLSLSSENAHVMNTLHRGVVNNCIKLFDRSTHKKVSSPMVDEKKTDSEKPVTIQQKPSASQQGEDISRSLEDFELMRDARPGRFKTVNW